MAEYESQPRPEHPQNRPGRPPRRRRRRVVQFILITGVIAAVFVVVLLALAPTIVSGYIPAAAQQNINDQIQGRATVGSATLSWRGPQRIGPIEIVDIHNRPVANIEIETSRGIFHLLGIVTGVRPMDLGTTTVTGSATVIRQADGTLHLQDVFQAGPPDAEPKDIHLPPGLTARFIVDGLDVTFLD
jgi:hypothetical protein